MPITVHLFRATLTGVSTPSDNAGMKEDSTVEPTDITIEVLGQIRDEIKLTRSDLSSRIDQTNARLDQTRVELGERIDQTNARIVEAEIRLATAVVGLSGSIEDVKEMLVQQFDLGKRVSRCETDIEQLKARVGI
jgi:hypothetical protein